MNREALARLRALVAALPPGSSLRGPSHLGRCPVLLREDLAAVLGMVPCCFECGEPDFVVEAWCGDPACPGSPEYGMEDDDE